MPKTQPFYSVNEEKKPAANRVYHDNSACPPGRDIPFSERRVGTNNRMLLQLWHVGRISHPYFLDGALPVAPSAIAAEGHVRQMSKTEPYPVPRALTLAEIPGIIEAYRKGAQNAQEAGFDAVEIHGANGYLLDQFLQDRCNKRTDRYGGSIENRARLML